MGCCASRPSPRILLTGNDGGVDGPLMDGAVVKSEGAHKQRPATLVLSLGEGALGATKCGVYARQVYIGRRSVLTC